MKSEPRLHVYTRSSCIPTLSGSCIHYRCSSHSFRLSYKAVSSPLLSLSTTLAMALSRSKSAPHVPGQAIKFTAPSGSSSRHAQMQRRASAFAVSSPSVRSVYESPARTGQQSPRVERRDDPFSLGGFFPSSLAAVHDRQENVEWAWLYEEDESEEVLAQSPVPRSSGYTTPSSTDWEEDEWALPSTPPVPMFDRGEDEICGETIKREDKLGILSLGMCLLV